MNLPLTKQSRRHMDQMNTFLSLDVMIRPFVCKSLETPRIQWHYRFSDHAFDLPHERDQLRNTTPICEGVSNLDKSNWLESELNEAYTVLVEFFWNEDPNHLVIE
jgi:hypothetical protein